MNYTEFIHNIIETRGQWSDEVRYSERGCERHHILPICLGGLPSRRQVNWQHHENIIWLYPLEHYEAHRLLVEEYPDNRSIAAAFWYMVHFADSTHEKYTAEQYELAKIAYCKSISGENSLMANMETRNKMRKSQTNRLANLSDEDRAKWHANQSKSLKGKPECGWKRGMTLETHYDFISRSTAGLRKYAAEFGNPALGKRWYNDGVIKIYVKAENCPPGFVKGYRADLPTIHCNKRHKNDLADYLRNGKEN